MFLKSPEEQTMEPPSKSKTSQRSVLYPGSTFNGDEAERSRGRNDASSVSLVEKARVARLFLSSLDHFVTPPSREVEVAPSLSPNYLLVLYYIFPSIYYSQLLASVPILTCLFSRLTSNIRGTTSTCQTSFRIIYVLSSKKHFHIDMHNLYLYIRPLRLLLQGRLWNSWVIVRLPGRWFGLDVLGVKFS